MSRQGEFLIYCTEQYKVAKNLTGKQVSELFSRYRVWDYIYSCFEALHTTGANSLTVKHYMKILFGINITYILCFISNNNFLITLRVKPIFN